MEFWPAKFPIWFRKRIPGEFGNQPIVSLPTSPPTAAMGWRAWWNPMDATTMFTDAGTTPVSADGDRVYRLGENLGVVANSYFDQTTLANRPVYKVNGAGGKSYLSFDGAAHYMSTLIESNFIAVGAKTYIISLSIEAGWLDNDEIYGDISGSEQFVRLSTTGNVVNYRNYDGNYDTSTGVPFTQSVPLVYVCKHDSGNLYDAKNSVVWTAAVASGNTTSTTRVQVLAARAANYAPFNLYSIAVANVVISDSNLGLVVNYFMTQMGLV